MPSRRVAPPSPLPTLTAAVLAVSIVSSAAAQRTETFTWSGRLASGRTFSVRGVNGDVRVERASGGAIELTATKRGRKDAPSTVEIRVDEEGDGITVCAVYPRGQRAEGCGRGSGNNEDNDVTVDFRVAVPDGVKVRAGTVNGDADVRDVTGDAEVSTVNGDAMVSSRGRASATTVNGDARAVIGARSWDDEITVRTVNGRATAWVARDAKVTVRGSTVNGALDTELPLTISGKWGPKRIAGSLNGGGSTLVLETVNGDVEVRDGKPGR
ncbi:MAG: hypothetical protein NW201_09675 [Gemmatimonadales bacterium]|nr:hypothetical protein [Gemmatimonadales bacterium]